MHRLKPNLPKMIGHRGAAGYAPENTLASLTKAQECGATWVEFDVMLAACGEPVIIHDPLLDRTTDGTGEVALTPYKIISTLDAGSWFSPQHAGERIPTLQQFLEHAMHLELGVNIEVKSTPLREKETAQNILEVVNSVWQHSRENVLISSFSQVALEAVHELGTKYPLGYVIDHWEEQLPSFFDRCEIASLHVNEAVLTKERVHAVKAKERLVLAYTVNDPRLAEQLISWGVDALFTDFPGTIPFSRLREKG